MAFLLLLQKNWLSELWQQNCFALSRAFQTTKNSIASAATFGMITPMLVIGNRKPNLKVILEEFTGFNGATGISLKMPIWATNTGAKSQTHSLKKNHSIN